MSKLKTLSYEFLKEIADYNRCRIEDLFDMEEEYELLVYDNKEDLFDWLYNDTIEDRIVLLEKVMHIGKEDFIYGDTILEIIINTDDRIYVDDKTGLAIFVY